jgi:hypothetical protein
MVARLPEKGDRFMASIQQIISNLPIGKSNAISASNLEQAIGNQPIGTNNDQTRDDIRRAIFDDEIPIGSCVHGYYLIDSNTEYQDLINKLNATITQYQHKISAITNGWQRRRQSKLSGNPWPK